MTDTDWRVPVRPPSKTTQPSNHDIFEVVRLVESLSPEYFNDREKWFRVGAVLYALFPSGIGLELFKRFSRQSRKYEPGDCESLWTQYEAYEGNRPGLTSLKEWADGEREGIKFHALNDYLQQDFQADYWVPGILAKNQPMIAGGAPKTFKTSLVMYMSLAIAAGGKFLGVPCEKGSVAFVSGESGDAANQSIIRRQLPSLGGIPENFFLTSQIPRFDQPLSAWEDALGELGVDILVVDPLYLAMKGTDANNVFEMGQQLKNIADVASRLGITLILIHHCTKSAARDHKPLSLNDLTWSGSAEFARQWFLLSHRKPYRDGEAQLYLSAGGSAGHSSLLHVDVHEGIHPHRTWDVTVRSNGEVAADQAEQKYQEVVQKVRNVLAEPMHKTKIRDAAGIKSKDWGMAFERMIDEGILVEGKKVGRHPTYKLPA